MAIPVGDSALETRISVAKSKASSGTGDDDACYSSSSTPCATLEYALTWVKTKLIEEPYTITMVSGWTHDAFTTGLEITDTVALDFSAGTTGTMSASGWTSDGFMNVADNKILTVKKMILTMTLKTVEETKKFYE